MRRFPVAGFILAVLTMVGALCTTTAHAGDVFPGVIFYANTAADSGNGQGWRTTGTYMGPLDKDTVWDSMQMQIGPPPGVIKVKKGGCAYSEPDGMGRPGFGVIAAPSLGEVAGLSTYDSGSVHTAFTHRRVVFRLDSHGDRLRLGGLSNACISRDAAGKCTANQVTTVTAYSSADVATIAEAFVYNKDGDPVEAFWLDFQPHAVIQVQYKTQIDAYTIQVVPGCQGFGPCPADLPLAYLIATNGPPTNATLQVVYGQNIGTEGAASTSITSAEASIAARWLKPLTFSTERVTTKDGAGEQSIVKRGKQNGAE